MSTKCPDCDTAERQLQSVQGFFPRIDAKVSALFAITSGQLAIAVINLAPNDLKHWYIAIPAALFMLITTAIYWLLYRCTYPHLEGGNNSLIYFREVAKLTENDFITRYRAYAASDRLTDIAGQIWHNSKIAALKYQHLKNATTLSMLSLLPWVATLLAISLSNWRGLTH